MKATPFLVATHTSIDVPRRRPTPLNEGSSRTKSPTRPQKRRVGLSYVDYFSRYSCRKATVE